MKMKRIVLLLLGITIIVSACKKYEDGPSVSFRSVKSRIYGNHTITKYTVDGIDSLQLMKDRFGIDIRFYYQDYDKVDVIDMSGQGISSPFISVYYLIDKKKRFTVKQGSILLTGNGNHNYSDVDFTILKLEYGEMHFKTSFNAREYYFELKRNP
jgi:hypothetical protein